MYSSSEIRMNQVKPPPFLSNQIATDNDDDVYCDNEESFLNHFSHNPLLDSDSFTPPDCYYLMKEHGGYEFSYSPPMSSLRLAETPPQSFPSASTRAKATSTSNIDEAQNEANTLTETLSLFNTNDRPSAIRPVSYANRSEQTDDDFCGPPISYEEFMARTKRGIPPRRSQSLVTAITSNVINRRVIQGILESSLATGVRSMYDAMMGQPTFGDRSPTDMSVCSDVRAGKNFLDQISYCASLMWKGFSIMGGGKCDRKTI